jgi:hypothetical protein
MVCSSWLRTRLRHAGTTFDTACTTFDTACTPHNVPSDPAPYTSRHG